MAEFKYEITVGIAVLFENDKGWNLLKIIVKPENAFVKKAFPGFCLKSSS
jgi:hypothetical protein